MRIDGGEAVVAVADDCESVEEGASGAELRGKLPFLVDVGVLGGAPGPAAVEGLRLRPSQVERFFVHGLAGLVNEPPQLAVRGNEGHAIAEFQRFLVLRGNDGLAVRIGIAECFLPPPPYL